MTKPFITHLELITNYQYDPLTGSFTHKETYRNGKPYREHRWNQEVGNLDRDGRRKCIIGGRYYSIPRLMWFYQTGKWPTGQIDHENGDHTDNRWKNLRDVTGIQNAWNRGATKRSKFGVAGIYRTRNGSYRAEIDHNKVRHYLGTFPCVDDAIAARRAAEVQFRGQFARKP
jgi:hypothetical protein